MTRKALNAFDPSKLGVGKNKIFEVRNQKTGFGEHHYFYRDHDGELFTVVCKGMNQAISLRDEWRKNKAQKEAATRTIDLKSITQGKLFDLLSPTGLKGTKERQSIIDELARRNGMIVDFLAVIESDERLSYPTATVDINAPLALVQCALDNQRRAVKHVLRILNGEVEK